MTHRQQLAVGCNQNDSLRLRAESLKEETVLAYHDVMITNIVVRVSRLKRIKSVQAIILAKIGAARLTGALRHAKANCNAELRDTALWLGRINAAELIRLHP